MKTCPFCAEEIQDAAKVCKHCGRDLDPRVAAAKAAPQWSPGIAAVLSLIIPGAGQMYKGQVGKGLALLVFTAMGYLLFIVPGLIIHLIAILDAYSSSAIPKNQQVICKKCKHVAVRGASPLCPQCGREYGSAVA